MNGTLHDLVDLYVYKKDGEYVCQIHFGGRIEPHDILHADELLGDIIALFAAKYDAVSEQMVREINLKEKPEYNAFGNLLSKHNGEYYLDVADVIVSCYPRNENEWMNDPVEYQIGMELGWKQTDIVDDTYLFLKELNAKDMQIDKKLIEVFAYSFGRYIPIHKRIYDFRQACKGKCLSEELPFIFREHCDTLECNLKKDTEYTVYRYECDDLIEIIIGLMHSLTLGHGTVKKCQVCNRYFLAKQRNDEKYCNRKVFDESCKTIGRKQQRRKRMKSAFVTKKYNSVCTNLAARIQAKKIEFNEEEKERRQEDLYRFRDEYIEKKNLLTEEQLLEWMSEYLSNSKRTQQQKMQREKN